MDNPGIDRDLGDQLKSVLPEYFPKTQGLPQRADRLLHALPQREVAAASFMSLPSKYDYWRDGEFVIGSSAAKSQFERAHPGEDFFKGTYFIVDTGIAHSIAVGSWLLNNNIDIAFAVPDEGKLTGYDRPGVILSLMHDQLKNRTNDPVGLATLLEVHRDDIAINNPPDNDMSLQDFVSPEQFVNMGINKVILLAERVFGSYDPKTLHGTLSEYIESVQKAGVDISIYGIDKVWNDNDRGRGSSYPQSYNSTTPEQLIAGFMDARSMSGADVGADLRHLGNDFSGVLRGKTLRPPRIKFSEIFPAVSKKPNSDST